MNLAEQLSRLISAAPIFISNMKVSGKKGLTLIEVLLSILILFVTTAVVVQALSVILRLETQSRYMSEAVPHLSTLAHDRFVGLTGEDFTFEGLGWALEPRFEGRGEDERLYELVPETLKSLRIPVIL